MAAMMISGTDFSDHLGTEAERQWPERMLLELQAHLPRMWEQHAGRREFWSWFSGEADSLARHLRSAEELGHYRDRLNALLEDAGVQARYRPALQAWPASAERNG